MKRKGLLAIATLVGLGGLAAYATASSKPAAPAKPKRAPALPLPPGVTPRDYYSGFVGNRALWGKGDANPDLTAVSRPNDVSVSAQLGRRAWRLFSDHKDARPEPDKYSRASLLVYRPKNLPLGAQGQTWGWFWSDEYGRPYEGWGVSVSPLAIATRIAQNVLPFIPGLGTAAAAGLATCIAISQGQSLKNAALAAARASLPPEAQLAFDVGVGLTSGQSVETVTVNAVTSQSPEAKAAYEQGRAISKAAA